MKILFFALLLSLQAYADYPSARLNQNVCEEISGQSYRLLPRKDWFCGAVDGQAYARTIGKRDYYHGVGHWTQVRTEFRWEESVAINFRSILYSATSSSGYAASNEDYHLASFRFIYPEKILGAFLTLRIVDLDRQSVGEGLFIEARESNGGLMLWDWDNVQFRWLQESTGFLVGDDDASNPEINFWGRRLGLGAMWFYKERPFLDKRKPYFYLYSNIPVDSGPSALKLGRGMGLLVTWEKFLMNFWPEDFLLRLFFRVGIIRTVLPRVLPVRLSSNMFLMINTISTTPIV